ncbi:hypothetical protein BDL97_17G054500 [Sphagnum fallax]|nr:hypothetical protein BDL97_17G054500 [Sphagnum fallax]
MDPPRGSSPVVLMQAVVKVEQVVARLQELQRTISAGLHKNPHTAAGRRKINWSAAAQISCSNQEARHAGIISEILKASEIAKSIATLVAECTLQVPAPSSSSSPTACSNSSQWQLESPDLITDPAAQKKPDHCITRTSYSKKHSKMRDISYPSSVQVHKSMAVKADQPEKHMHTMMKSKRVAFPGESREVLRELDKRSMISSVDPHLYLRAQAPITVLSKQTPNVQVPMSCKEDSKSYSATECCSGAASVEIDGVQQIGVDTSLAWREHCIDDHEQLEEEYCNFSMEATEIKSQLPWKLISMSSSKGVMFPNRVFTPSPDKHSAHQIEFPANAAPTAKFLKPQTPLQMLRWPSKSSLKVGDDYSFKRILQSESPEIAHNLLASSELEDELSAPASDHGTTAPVCEILEPSGEQIFLRKRSSGLGKSVGKDDHSPRRKSYGKQLKPMDGNIMKLVAAAATLQKNAHHELCKKPVSQEHNEVVSQGKLIKSHSSRAEVKRGSLEDEKQRGVGGNGSESSRRFTEKENNPLLACAPARRMLLRDLSRGKGRQQSTTARCSKQLRY